MSKTKKNHSTESDKSESEKAHNSYDALFKHFMSNPNNAMDFFDLFLAKEIWAKVNKQYMELCPESFVDNKLKHKHVDILYRTRFDNEDGYIYILSEEQTQPDKALPFRIMQYILRIIEMHKKQFKTDAFPIVYPLIFHVGKKEYPYSTDFFDGFGEHKALAKSILMNPFPVANVTGVTDEDLNAHPLAGTLSRVYQLANARDLIFKLKKLKPKFYYIDTHSGSDSVLSMLEFTLSKTEKGDADTVVETVQHMVSEETKGKIMTLVQQLENRGILKGMQQGMHLKTSEIANLNQRSIDSSPDAAKRNPGGTFRGPSSRNPGGRFPDSAALYPGYTL